MATETFNSIWHVDPGSGEGNMVLSISAEPNTGRNSRNIILSADGPEDISSTNKLSVTQDGEHMPGKTSGGFIMVVNPTNSIDADGGDATFTGETNLQTLKLILPNTTITEASVIVNEVKTDLSSSDIAALTGSSGYSPSGDPGASNSYKFAFTAHVGENLTQDNRTFTGTIGLNDVVADLSVTQLSPGASSSEIWFSNGQSSTSSANQVSVTVSYTGVVTSGNPYINTIPSDLSWELKSV